MNSKVHYRLWVSLATIAIGSLVFAGATSLALADTDANAHKMQKSADKSSCQMCQTKMEHMQKMTELRDLLAQAKDTARAEGAKKTLAKINEAQKLLEQEHKNMHGQMAQHMKKMHPGQAVNCPMCGKMCGKMRGTSKMGKVANNRCPITGNKFDPKNVPTNLTREWKGQKIGFCCPNCLPQWDKLSDKQKQAKLDAAKTSPPSK